jgi:hypothetical protein
MISYVSLRPRRGATIIEFVVACSLLGSLMLLVVPSAIRITRVQRMMRHHRIAMDEITNQLDRLGQLPIDQIEEQLITLTPSEFALAGLPNPSLSGSLHESAEGYRLAIQISWDSPGQNVAPLTMATWLFPTPTTESLDEEHRT